MGLNKIRLGDYIIRSTQNNRDLKYGVELISGVTSQGIFAIPKGEPIDVNLKPYKIVNNGAFVYNPTRLNLGSIAYRTDGLCIVSHLYMVFYLTEEGKRIIDPTWLYIYFRRNEFLREVTFRNFGSQRPEFNFEDKEKTISDTIEFEEDYKTAIREIVQIFDNETLNKFSTAEKVKDILDIMSHCQSYNLRSFIFACQKTNDIFERLDEKYLSDENFVQAVFIGILSFVLKQKNGNSHAWGNEKYFSAVLGHEKAPLFKFCYDYIMKQITEFEDIEGAYQAYSELVLYDKNRSNNDNDIITLQTYYVRTDSDVLDAINSIERRLEVPEDISFYQYGTIAVYAIIIKGILGCNIDTIKRRLVSNLEGQGNKLELEQIFRTIIGTDCTTEQKEEYESLRKEMARSLKKGDKIIPNFDYQPGQSKDFYDYAITNEGKFHTQESFAAQFDMKQVSEMFRNSTAEQKQQIRGAFVGMYRIGNIKSFLANDRESIVQLLEFIKADRSDDVGDRIQQLQYDCFIKNLEEIKRKLS